MFDIFLTAITGGATGIVGSLLGKVFGFVDLWFQEKKAQKDHVRTLQMLELQNKFRGEESERELAMAEANLAAKLRVESYGHDKAAGSGSIWVVDVLRLVRPVLTFTLILLVGTIYFNEPVGRDAIEASVIYMMSSATLWWFGDRALRKK